jgi:3-hydroxybutyryl-CoA dehydratase
VSAPVPAGHPDGAPNAPRPFPAVGDTATRTRVVTDADIAHFGDATGDRNPVHFDDAYAAGTRFGGRIAHGMLTAGLVSAAIANELPGPGAVYLSQSLQFRRPVRPGDAITVRLEVLAVDATARRVRLATACTNQDGKTVLDGEAEVMMPA